MQANKNGFFYVIDRITGQFISAQPFSQVTWAEGHRSEDRPADREPGGVLRHRRRSRSLPAAAARTTGRRCRSIRSTGLVYIPTSTANSFSYAAEPTFDPRPGAHDGHRSSRAGRQRGLRRRRSDRRPSKGPADAARSSRGIRSRSRCDGACPAAAASAAAR